MHRLPGRLAVLSEPATLAAALATTLAATLTYVPSPTGCPRHLRLRVQRGAKRAATTDPVVPAPSIS